MRDVFDIAQGGVPVALSRKISGTKPDEPVVAQWQSVRPPNWTSGVRIPLVSVVHPSVHIRADEPLQVSWSQKTCSVSPVVVHSPTKLKVQGSNPGWGYQTIVDEALTVRVWCIEKAVI